jgi:hypothetical protein
MAPQDGNNSNSAVAHDPWPMCKGAGCQLLPPLQPTKKNQYPLGDGLDLEDFSIWLDIEDGEESRVSPMPSSNPNDGVPFASGNTFPQAQTAHEG